MTREEEIKARLEKAQVNASSYPVTEMDADLAYLLARNEELQRRVEKMQAVVDAARELDLKILYKRKPQDYVHTFATCDKTNNLVMALQKLDAKEHPDA